MIKRTIAASFLVFAFALGYYFASGDPMSGTITSINGDVVTVTDVCGRDFTFRGAEDYAPGDTVAFIYHKSHVLRVRYTG